MNTRCAIVDDGERCYRPADTSAPLNLCTAHLLVAHDWVVRDVGVTDVLPAPCLACGSRLGTKYPSGWLCAICEWRAGDIPDPEGAPPRIDVVYYLRFRERIKIGTSANPRARFAALPHDEVLAFERGGRELEQRRHAQFAALRWPGSEWFRLADDLSEHIRLVGADEPWAKYALWCSQEWALR